MAEDGALTPAAWIARHEEAGATPDAALAFFDSLPPVALDAMTGRWRGSGLPTGHPLDGLLEALGWYGKDFVDRDTVHPLLFAGAGGEIVALDSHYLPMGGLTRLRLAPELRRRLFGPVRALFQTKKPTARIRMLEHRGKISAAMIYDFVPIIDIFRRIDEATLLGVMDWRDEPRPFFFVLRRAD
jgi:hypothetical protein